MVLEAGSTNVAASDELQEQGLADALTASCSRRRWNGFESGSSRGTWEAFRLTAVEEALRRRGGRRAGVKVAATFKAKSKDRQLIRDEVERAHDDLVCL